MNLPNIHQFNRILQSNGSPSMQDQAFASLRETMGDQALLDLSDLAGQGDQGAVDKVLRVCQVAQAQQRLHALGFANVTLRQTQNLLTEQGVDAVRKMLVDAGHRNPKALEAITKALHVTNQASTSSREGSMPPPAQSRPTSHAGAPPPAPSQAPPSNRRVTGQAYRNDNAPRAQSIADQRWGRDEQGGAPPQEPAHVTPRTYDQAKAHGGRAALTFAADHSTRDLPTVVVEAALIVPGRDRVYDWQNKLRFQLTSHELQLVSALLLGKLGELHFSNHGERNDKWLSITRQDDPGRYAGTIKFTLGQGKAADFQPRTVQVDTTSMGMIMSLFLRQTMRLLKLEDGILLDSTLQQVASAHTLQQAGRNHRGAERSA